MYKPVGGHTMRVRGVGISRWLCCILLVSFMSTQYLVPCLAWERGEHNDAPAQAGGFQARRQADGPAASAALLLDLSSTQATMTLGTQAFANGVGAGLNLGGTTRSYGVGDLVTPAEYAALMDMAAHGTQNLTLGEAGQATGGQFSLANMMGSIASLVVPQGVTAIGEVSHKPFTVSGTVSVDGMLIGLGSRGAKPFTVSAGDVLVGEHGTISTVVPQNLLNLSQASTQPVDLSLRSLNDVLNDGTISASGNLEVIAGSGKFTNNGLISALAGNVTFNTGSTTDLTLNNAGGLVQAEAGAIIFRDASFEAKNLTSAFGGSLTAQSLDFYGGDGLASFHPDNVSGVINVNAGLASMVTQGGEMRLGTLNLTGDPIFANSNGDVILTNSLVFSGMPLAILASEDVIFEGNATKIDLSSKTASGGDLYIMAGVAFTPSTSGQEGPVSGPYTVTGVSSTGGSIFMDGVSIDTSSASKTNTHNGGKVTMVAMFDDAGTGHLSVGAIKTTAAGGNGGAIDIMASGTSSIVVVSADASGGNNGGDVSLRGAIANANSATFNGGALTSGTITPGTTTNTPITVGTTAKQTSALEKALAASGFIKSTGTNGSGGDAAVTTGDAPVEVDGVVNLNGKISGGTYIAESDDTVAQNGNINTSGGKTPTSNGGSVTITGNNGVFFSPGTIQTSGGASGGNLTVNSPNGPVVGSGAGLADYGTKLKAVFKNVPANTVKIFTEGTNANTSSLNGVGGDISINANNGMSWDDFLMSGLGEGGALSLDGGTGSVWVEDVNTSSPGGNAGDINASGGGALFLGNLIAAGNRDGGDATFTFPGGITIFNINTSQSLNQTIRSDGGDVVLQSLGPINIFGGINTSADLRAGNITILGTAGPGSGPSSLFIGGLLDARGIGSGSGGNVHMTLGGSANLGGINTTGSTGGNVQVIGARDLALHNQLFQRTLLRGNVTAWGFDSIVGNAGSGGDVSIENFTHVQVQGDIITRGGNAKGKGFLAGNGGNAGAVTILTNTNEFGTSVIPDRVGGVDISGIVDAHGGTTTDPNTKTNGTGGDVDVRAGTLQVRGNKSGSIITTGGNNGTASGSVNIETFGTQPFPADFTPAQANLKIPALPGALFQVGNASVNGTGGAIVAGPDKMLPSNIVYGGNETVGGISVSALNENYTIDQDGTDISIFAAKNNDPLQGRQLVTVGQALALFQVSRDSDPGAQTVGLTGVGAVSNLAIGGGINGMIVPAYELAVQFRAFELKTAIAGQEGSFQLTVDVSDRSPVANLFMASKTPMVIWGQLNFSNSDIGGMPKLAQFDMGSTPLTIMPAGGISTGAEVPLEFLFNTTSANINNGGSISSLAGMTFFNSNAKGNLTLIMNNGSFLNGPGVARFQTGPENALAGTITIKTPAGVNAAIDNLALEFFGGNVVVGAGNAVTKTTSLAPHFIGTSSILTVQATGSVSINSAHDLFIDNDAQLMANGQITMVAPNLLFFGTNAAIATGAGLTLASQDSLSLGTSLFAFVQKDINISSNAGVSSNAAELGSQIGSILFFADDTINMSSANNLVAGTNIALSSGNTLTFNGIALAGTLNPLVNLPDDQPLPKTAVVLPGKVTLRTTNLLTVGANSMLDSFGGDVSVVSNANNVIMGDNAIYAALGGNISILAQGNVVGGAAGGNNGNTLYAVSGPKGGGGIEIAAGTTTSQIANLVKSRPSPPTQSVPAGITVNTLPGGNIKGNVFVNNSVTLLNTNGNTTVNTFNGVVFVQQNGVGTVTLDSAAFTTVCPISFEQVQISEEDQIVDTGACFEEAEDDLISQK